MPDQQFSLENKVKFLSFPQAYGNTLNVEVLETHMSWVFLTDRYVYKLKKPVCFDFLDFRTAKARFYFCLEELRQNQKLAPGIYLNVVPLMVDKDRMVLNGQGTVIDWLVKMRRLPEENMLHKLLKGGSPEPNLVELAAKMLTDFYLTQKVYYDEGNSSQFLMKLAKAIDNDKTQLLQESFGLPHDVIVRVDEKLQGLLKKFPAIFEKRAADKRIIECHGDLRPEHICLNPCRIIDCIEFNNDLRIMDVAEELSFLAIECETLRSPETGQRFINVYKEMSKDDIPEKILVFYKAKRAFLRARLTIRHLFEERYLRDGKKWKARSRNYLKSASDYCRKL